MKEEIIKYCNSIDIPIVGFTKLDEKSFRKENNKYDINKNVIVIGVPYYKKNIKIKENEVYFSSSSWGEDYHKVLRRKMVKVIDFINDDNAIPEVDTSILDDRYLALKSGIGFLGKNNLIINETYGSYFFIGTIITSIQFEIDKPLNKTCLNCNLCLEACPTKALNKEGYDMEKCLAYITQKKGELTKEEIKSMNQCIYGCDICQEVCPYNKNNKGIKDFELQGKEIINIDEYKSLSNKEFKEKYGDLSGSWRGKNVIERNIDIYRRKQNGRYSKIK